MDVDRLRYATIGNAKLTGIHHLGSVKMCPSAALMMPAPMKTQISDDVIPVHVQIASCPKRAVTMPKPTEIIAKPMGGKRCRFVMSI